MLATTEGYSGFWSDPQLMLWSGVFRMSQAVIAAAPFLLTGMLVTGVLRGMIGEATVRRLFGVGHWSGPIRGWFLGILLPLCSLGALPVARELRRAGVPSATVLSFVLVAPVLNPISILYGISHITLITLLYFLIGTMIVSLGIGFIWDNLVSKRLDVVSETPESLPSSAFKRVAITGVSSTRGVLSSLPDVAMAVLAVGLLGAFLPYGTLQASLTRDNALATVIMGGVAIPAYVTPFEVMVQYGLIVRDGYSLGAGFALIVLGAGANVGVANWIRREYRYKALAVFLLLLLGTTLFLGLTADRVVYYGKVAVGHTHAFDSYTRLSSIYPDPTYVAWYLNAIGEKLTVPQAVGISTLGLMLFGAIALRLLGDRASISNLMKQSEREEPVTGSVLQRPVSMGVVIAVGSLGLMSTIGIAIFIIHPPKDQLIGEANVVSYALYDAVRDNDHDEINRRIQEWDMRVRKVPIAMFIRGEQLPEEALEAIQDVIHLLESLRRYNEHGESEKAATLYRFLEQRYYACRQLVKT
ncbi:MAG: permease [Phycisphaerae bacterium]